jgi:broad specificity phosphatase PhoE
MVEITFVRHGQAQTGARDEASYDRLSELGAAQAGWLGEHFAATGRGFDRVLSGGLLRQRATAQAIAGRLGLPVDEDRRLDEMDYFGLARALREIHALDLPTDRAGFLAHMPQVLSAWERGDIAAPSETFAAFEARVRAAIDDAEAAGGRVLMVTSGGVIGMAMRLLLRLEVPVYANVLLQVYNASVHRYVKAGDALVLDCFNAVPHLERPDRLHALTWT